MVRVITIPNGKRVTLGQYCAAWKALKGMDPQAEVKGWEWYTVPASHVLRRMREGLEDRINRRGGLVIRTASEKRIRRQLERRIKHSCRWCGRCLGRYAPDHARFCDAECRRDYWG